MKKRGLITASAVFLAVSAAAIVAGIAKTRADSVPARLIDGRWEGTGAGLNGPITISLTVKDGSIVEGAVLSEDETDFAKPAIQDSIAQLIKTGSVKKVDTVSGATFTSKGTIEAMKNALALANGGKAEPKKAYKNAVCDIAIVGAGGAGLSAAVEASLRGAHVIVLEKRGLAGGNTNYATGGLNASETSVQQKLGIQDSNEQYYEDTMKGGKNINDAALVRNMVNLSAETVDWLISLGADLSDVGKMAGSTNPRTHRPKGGGAVGGHLVDVLKKAAEDSGVEIRYDSTVTDLIVKNGGVHGVKVESNGKIYTVKSKAVVIASGGFGANIVMVAQYRPEFKDFGTTNQSGATGDAFTWAKQLDIALTQMEQIQTHPTVVPKKGVMITEAVRGNGAIMVNREGKRFNNEMATRDVLSSAILEQTGKTAFILFDQNVRESLKAIEGYARNGLLTEGETLTSLAEKLAIPQAELENTVKKYNAFQAAGKDEDFGRAASDMTRPIVKAPFYAVEVAPAVHHTMGGIKINTKSEALNNSGAVIPGLFAAGEVTGGIHGANRLGGNAVADICIYGRTAGDSAADFIKR